MSATQSASPLAFDHAAIRNHVEMLHSRAAGIAGVLVVSVFFETGPGTITHHKVGDVDGMVAAIVANEATPGANVYTGLQVSRPGLTRGKRGGSDDVVAVLGLVADMDGDTGKTGQMPVPASYAVETSAGNTQQVVLFDGPVSPAEAKPLAEALKRATGADNGTGDIAHIWRIPGTLNHPSKTKLDRGRSPDPYPVTVVRPFSGVTYSRDALEATLGPAARKPESAAEQFGERLDAGPLWDRLSDIGRVCLTADGKPDRSAHVARVIEQLHYEGFTLDEAVSLCLEHAGAWSKRYTSTAAMVKDLERCWAKFAKPKDEQARQNAEFASGFAKKTANDNEPPKNDNARFQITWFDDVNQSVTKGEIVKGVFGEDEVSNLVGKPGSTKSVLGVDLGCHIAAGMDWHGRAVRQGMVVFYAAERKKLTERRIAAWAKHHGVSNIPFVVVGGKLDLTTNLTDAKALAQAITQLEQKCGHRCVLVILDTLSRTFGPGNQNESKDMNRYVASVDAIQRATGAAHVLIIHHSTWAEDRGKGAIDLDGAIDASFDVAGTGTGPNKRFTFACTGANDGEEGAITTYTLESVVLGTDDEGNETSAPVVIQADPAPKRDSTSHTEFALAVLEREIAENGQHAPDGSPGFPEGVMVALQQLWRERFYAECRDINADAADATIRKRFDRALTNLLKVNRVGKAGQWCWPVHAEPTGT